MTTKELFDWAAREGEVKAVDRILVKVMLQLVKHKITLTAKSISQLDEKHELPSELQHELLNAAESVVGKPYPGAEA